MFERYVEDYRTWRSMPRVQINLDLAATEGNDPFYSKLVREYFASTQRRSRKIPLMRDLTHGVALCMLPLEFDQYFMQIDASARRNYKKALRKGYQFGTLDFNARLAEVEEIWKSTETRQGRMTSSYLAGSPRPHSNPPTTSTTHDYPYFGIEQDGRLVAYASGLVSGDLFMIQQIFGHADFHTDGVVPLLIIEIARATYERYRNVSFYAYGMYFGAGDSMRRFKRKFGFQPFQVQWRLGEVPQVPAGQWVYRMRRDKPLLVDERTDAEFFAAHGLGEMVSGIAPVRRTLGLRRTSVQLAKVVTASRESYFAVSEGRVECYVGVTLGRCRHYLVPSQAAVLGPVWTLENARGRGLATWLMKQTINDLISQGRHEFYIDTAETNQAMQKVLEKCGFGSPLLRYPRYR